MLSVVEPKVTVVSDAATLALTVFVVSVMFNCGVEASLNVTSPVKVGLAKVLLESVCVSVSCTISLLVIEAILVAVAALPVVS